MAEPSANDYYKSRSISPYSMILASQKAMRYADEEPEDEACVPDAMSIDGPEPDDRSQSETSVTNEPHEVEASDANDNIPDERSSQHAVSEVDNNNPILEATQRPSSEDQGLIEESIEDQDDQTVVPTHKSRKANKGWLQQACDADYLMGAPKQFECAHHIVDSNNLPCDTLQEYYSPKETARPVIAHFFGHNKNEWEQIPKDKRIYLCRKHYQKLWHHGDNVEDPLAQNAKPCMQLKLIRIMLDRIENWRSDPRFTFKLSKSMDDKTKHYHELVSGGMSVQDAAAQIDEMRREFKVEPQQDESKGDTEDVKEHGGEAASKRPRRVTKSKAKGKIEEKTPVLFALDVKRRFEGGNKSSDDVRAIYDWLESKLADRSIRSLPAIETLLDLPAEHKTRKKTKTSHTQTQSTSEAVFRHPSPLAGPSTISPVEPATTVAPINIPDPVPQPTPLQELFSQIRRAILNAGINMNGFTIKLEGPPSEETPTSDIPDPRPRPTIILRRLNGGRDKGKGKMPETAAATESRPEKRKRSSRPSEVDSDGRGDSMEPAKRSRQEDLTGDNDVSDEGIDVKMEMED